MFYNALKNLRQNIKISRDVAEITPMAGNVKKNDEAAHMQQGDKRRRVGDPTSHKRLVPHKMWVQNKIIESLN
jgi:hypothetical protein